MTSSKPSTTLSPLSTPSKYFSVEAKWKYGTRISLSVLLSAAIFWFISFFLPPLKIWVWFCHLHRLGRSLPDCSGGLHAGRILPKREVYTQIPHVQTPQQQRVCVNWTLIQRLIEHFHIPASHILEKEYRKSSFYILFFQDAPMFVTVYILRNALLK